MPDNAVGPQAMIARVRSIHRKLTGCDCDRGCAWPSSNGGCAPPDRCMNCQVRWPCPTIQALDAEDEHTPGAETLDEVSDSVKERYGLDG